ncbi:MAG: DUF58 domain-containing protein [Euryarchaeota archaeon]|nr:DUF58 domain-containing protein [Euryarchaeota archaeon]
MEFRATRRLLHLGVFVGLAVLVALLEGTWIPSAALIPLMGVLLVAFLEVILPLPITLRRQIDPPGNLLIGDEATVEVRSRPAPLPMNLVIDDGIPEGLAVVPGSREAFEASARGVAVARYKVKPRRRGEYDIVDATVRRVSMLGLFERSETLPGATHVIVLPAGAKQLGVKVRPRPPVRTSEMSRSLRAGAGDEFYALREYLPGDPLGNVNWKATARMNRIITNEFQPQEPPRYLLYVDTRATTAEVGEADAFERTLELAAILVEALIEARAHVGLVLLSFHSVFLVPSPGANQLRRLRQLIIDAQPGQDAPLMDLVHAGVAHLPARADAILLTANAYDPTLAQAVTFLRARHGRCNVLFPGFPEPSGKTLDAAAQRAAGVLLNTEQSTVLAGLAPYADVAAQWPPGEPILMTLGRLGMAGRTR